MGVIMRFICNISPHHPSSFYPAFTTVPLALVAALAGVFFPGLVS